MLRLLLPDAVRLGERLTEVLKVCESDAENDGVQVRLDMLPLKLTVRVLLRLPECVTLRLPDLDRLHVHVYEPVPESVLVLDGLPVHVKLRLALQDAELVELSDTVLEELKVALSILETVQVTEFVIDPEAVVERDIVSVRLERLSVRLFVAEDATVGLSLLL